MFSKLNLEFIRNNVFTIYELYTTVIVAILSSNNQIKISDLKFIFFEPRMFRCR